MTKKPIQITCGVLITNGIDILVCHPTHNTTWDIPKGRLDEGETEIEAAIRELREETGLITSAESLTALGTFNYKHNKQLCLFKWQVETMPDVTKLTCVSMFKLYGKEFPEMDDFCVVSINEALDMFNKDLSRIILSILG
jgi:8-oxo-dGTP pyrophosphatase MutT (NUDIX family)